MKISTRVAAAIFFALTASPASAGAVSADPALPDTTVSADSIPDDVAHLIEEARELTSRSSDLGRASRRFREAAELMQGSPEAAGLRAMAGRLAWYAGDVRRAVTDLRDAGEQALEWGDVVTAAGSWLDAAWVAAGSGRTEEALALIRRAERVSSSPLIGTLERDRLEDRLEDFRLP